MNFLSVIALLSFGVFASQKQPLDPTKDAHVCSLRSRWGPVVPSSTGDRLVRSAGSSTELQWIIKPQLGVICTIDDPTICMAVIYDDDYGYVPGLLKISDPIPVAAQFDIIDIGIGIEIRSRAYPDMCLDCDKFANGEMMMWRGNGSNQQVFVEKDQSSLAYYNRMTMPMF